MFYFIFSLLIIVLVFFLVMLILTAIFPLKVFFSLDSEKIPDFNLTFSWLFSFLKGCVVKEDNNFILTIKILGIKVLSKPLEGNKGNYMDKLNLLKAINPHCIEVRAYYGFVDPSITGMVCGALDIATQYINLIILANYPDFFTDKSFFNVSGEAKLKIIPTLLRYRKYKKPALDMKTAY